MNNLAADSVYGKILADYIADKGIDLDARPGDGIPVYEVMETEFNDYPQFNHFFRDAPAVDEMNDPNFVPPEIAGWFVWADIETWGRNRDGVDYFMRIAHVADRAGERGVLVFERIFRLWE